MGARILALVVAAASALPAATDPLAAAVTRKLEQIENGQAKPGSVVRLSLAELNAWVRATAPEAVGDGVREPRIVLGNNTATGYALLDFVKLRRAAGGETSWLLGKLIQGEEPVVVKASLISANGRATVHLLRVDVGGLTMSGAALDFLIRNFLLPLYPDAKIDEPFDLDFHIERIELTPQEARIYIRK